MPFGIHQMLIIVSFTYLQNYNGQKEKRGRGLKEDLDPISSGGPVSPPGEGVG